jgi:phosphoribosylformimino-5-aminoimidazole carboxamide ribotide isomerase
VQSLWQIVNFVCIPATLGPMQIWPAIDLRDGRCVRLQQGDFRRETVFSDEPADVARRWADNGAAQLHLVDLDAARDGSAKNRVAIEAILESVAIPCELGGGIRSEATIRGWLEAGMSRLVVGTRAIKEPSWFLAMCEQFPHRLALGIDARNRRVATDGWLNTSHTDAIEFAHQFHDAPVAAIIYTDISKDGMMAGPNFTAIAEMHDAVKIPVIASGGVTTVDDIRQLAALGIAGCIIGRTLYDGRLTIAEAIRAAQLAT